MKLYTGLSKSAAIAAAFLFVISACGGDDAAEPVQAADTVQFDGADPADALQCAAPVFDRAELLYTEIDRQWICSVSSAQATFTDELFFMRSGTAVFSRFGQVYWNRVGSISASAGEITIASPTIESRVLSEISSANTVLQFAMNQGAAEENYDCVLAGREVNIQL
ncbi:hypothetical protein AB833_22750 [Chromatiales bacterium (ex Bugula neritina AB1)]|nr:hypothetical protein AB833_22750 [Chromatiales bacterium (ex Bugula neritina AB1)]